MRYKDNVAEIPIDDVNLKVFYYHDMVTFICSDDLSQNKDIEFFLCKAYKSLLFNQFPDKSIEWRMQNSTIVLQEIIEEKPEKLIVDFNVCIEEIIYYYIGKKNFNLLNIDFENIQNIAFLEEKKNIDCKNPQSGLRIIFTTLDKIYLVENCIDC